ncbi:hypothetical protein ACP70R_038790 [Stipagrostis hirtigluma subsp. patula]
MKISELSPEYRQPPPHAGLLTDLNRVVADVEAFDTSDSSAEKLAADLRRLLTNLASAGSSSSGLNEAFKLKVWNLGFRLWNACVDRANSNALARGPAARVAEAEIRQAAPELLLLAGIPDGIPSAAAKAAALFHRTGMVWLDLGRADLASACFEKATPLVSAADTEEDQAVLLGLNLARARAASGAGEQALAVALLRRCKPLAAASPEWVKALAEEYLLIGKAALSTKSSDPALDASSLLTEALDLCEKAAASLPCATPTTPRSTPTTPNVQEIKDQCLRLLAVERLEANDYDGTLRCIAASRASLGLGEEHPSLGVIAMRAWLGSGNMAEAARELEGLIANAKAPDNVRVSAAEEYLASAGPEAALKVLVALAARCRAGGAAAAVRVLKKVVEGGSGGTRRARAVAELVSDERVVTLFDGPANSHDRGTMHTLLWNCGTDHFLTKNYDTSADLIERSMLYLPRDDESRSRRADCFRVLSLCHIALQHLDRAQEFINEAVKVEPNTRCAFLKFKIHVLKKEEDEAIRQMKIMVGYADFDPQFLALAIHEAIACKSVRVAVASLTFLLGLYSPGKPMPMTEVAVLRNLIALLLREPGSEAEILKYSRRAKLRMAELGVEAFFGKGTVGLRELNWFAVNARDMALRVANEKKYDYCAEFFELAAEFFGSSNGEDDANHLAVCESLIMSVSSMLHAEEISKSPLSDSEIKKGVEMLNRAGKLLPLTWPSAPVTSDRLEDDNLPFLHAVSFYRLLDRMDTSAHTQQLQLVKSFVAYKQACTPGHLLRLGELASQGTQPNLHVAEFALKTSITTALASHSPNYRVISCALRKLVRLAGVQDSSGSNSDASYDVFRQAYQIVVGLRDGEYPSEEGKWLATTAWNKSYLAVRLGQPAVARKWGKMGLDLARHFESMKQHISEMEEQFEQFQKVSGKEPDECSQQDGAPSTSMSGSMSQPVLV